MSSRKGSTPTASEAGSEESALAHLAEGTLTTVNEDEQEGASWRDPSKAAEAAAEARPQLSRIDSSGREASAVAPDDPASAPAPTAAAVAVVPAAEQPEDSAVEAVAVEAATADSAAAERTEAEAEMGSTETRPRTHTLGLEESVSAKK